VLAIDSLGFHGLFVGAGSRDAKEIGDPKGLLNQNGKLLFPSCHFSGVTHVKTQYQATSIFGKKKSGAS